MSINIESLIKIVDRLYFYDRLNSENRIVEDIKHFSVESFRHEWYRNRIC